MKTSTTSFILAGIFGAIGTAHIVNGVIGAKKEIKLKNDFNEMEDFYEEPQDSRFTPMGRKEKAAIYAKHIVGAAPTLAVAGVCALAGVEMNKRELAEAAEAAKWSERCSIDFSVAKGSPDTVHPYEICVYPDKDGYHSLISVNDAVTRKGVFFDCAEMIRYDIDADGKAINRVEIDRSQIPVGTTVEFDPGKEFKIKGAAVMTPTAGIASIK